MVAAERGGVTSAPEEPQEVLAELAFRGAFPRVVTRTGGCFAPVHQRFAGQLLAAERELQELALVVHGDTAMVEQIAVEALVQPAFGVQETDMALQFFAA